MQLCGQSWVPSWGGDADLHSPDILAERPPALLCPRVSPVERREGTASQAGRVGQGSHSSWPALTEGGGRGQS